MSHEIDVTAGQASFASARIDAWHKLGTVLPDLMTASEALEAAHLAGWNVRKKELFIESDPVITDDGVIMGQRIEVPSKYATVRTNPINGNEDVLGVVGDQYTVIQNEAHADLLDTMVDTAGARGFETAGALFGGRQVFLSMKLPRSIDLVVPGQTSVRDVTDLYLVAHNSHDGSSAFRFLITPVRVVCKNTLSAAFGNMVSSFAVRHTVNAGKHIEVARQALGITWKYVDTFEAKLAEMINREPRREQAELTLRKVFRFDQKSGTVTERVEKGQKERVDEVMALWMASPTLTGFHGSSYGLYQAVAEWADHFSPAWGKTADENERQRAERIVKGGEMQRIKNDAFALLSS